MKKLFMFSVCIFAAATLSAKVQLPALLQDNMVLQQQTEANLWGKADPQKKVTVTTSWDKGHHFMGQGKIYDPSR